MNRLGLVFFLMVHVVHLQSAEASNGFLQHQESISSVNITNPTPISGCSGRRLGEATWEDVDGSLIFLADYLGKLFNSYIEDKPVPPGAYDAVVKSLVKLGVVGIKSIGGMVPAVIASGVAGLLIGVKTAIDPKKVAEKVYLEMSLKDVLTVIGKWKHTLELHATASAELQRKTFNDLGQWLDHHAMQVIFGHDCIRKADLTKAGAQVPQIVKDSCWEWQRSGAPMEYGNMLALLHLDTYGELLQNPKLANSDAKARAKDEHFYRTMIEDLKERYSRYLMDANEAYGVYQQDRAQFLMDPKWMWSWWVWKQLTRGRDCWFSDEPEACLDVRHTSRFECTENCDVLTSKCEIDKYYSRTGNLYPGNPNVYYWYVKSWDQERIDSINTCWSQYKKDLPGKHENMKAILQKIQELRVPAKPCDYEAHEDTTVVKQGLGSTRLSRFQYSSDDAYLSACKARCNEDASCGGFVDVSTQKIGWRMCAMKTASSGIHFEGYTFYAKQRGNGC